MPSRDDVRPALSVGPRSRYGHPVTPTISDDSGARRRPTTVGLDEAWAAPADALLLLCAQTPLERRLLTGWAHDLARTGDGDPVPTLGFEDPGLDAVLGEGPDHLVVPARVVWPVGRHWLARLPHQVATLARPPARRVRSGRRAAPRVSTGPAGPAPRVLVGEPARVSSLRARADALAVPGLGDFVRRQGLLTLERAERSLHGDRYKVPRMVAEDIRASARYADLVRGLTADLGLPEAEVRAQSEAALEEMVSSESPIAVDTWNRLGAFVSRAYEVHAETSALAGLRELNRDCAIAFLPNHRSYLDPVVLRALLARHGWPPNRVLGGANLSFWPLGPLARRSGVVFIRRSFRDAPVYKAMLREYLAYLLSKRFNVEWYIEGGRTRTGKLRPPRFGLLRYIVDALDEGRVADVALVPVSIVYDLQTEVGSIAAEERGAQKQPEGIGWLLRYIGVRGQVRSAVHVRIGAPLRLREALLSVHEDGAQPPAPGRGASSDLDVAKVAFEVCHRINDVTPVTATALVSVALLGAQGRAITSAQGRELLEPLLAYVAARGLPITHDVSLTDPSRALEALRGLVNAGVVAEHHDTAEPVYSIRADKELEAAFYRNTLVHCFVNRAITEVALLRAGRSGAHDLPAATWGEALRLRDLLKYEFFFPRKRVFADDVEAEMLLLDPGWRQREASPGLLLEALAQARPLVAPLMLQPFLEAYSVAAEIIASRGVNDSVSQREFLVDCGRTARQRQLQGQLVSAEANSRELFRNAHTLAANRGLLDPTTPDLAGRREAFSAELAERVAVVAELRAMARAQHP